MPQPPNKREGPTPFGPLLNRFISPHISTNHVRFPLFDLFSPRLTRLPSFNLVTLAVKHVALSIVSLPPLQPSSPTSMNHLPRISIAANPTRLLQNPLCRLMETQSQPSSTSSRIPLVPSVTSLRKSLSPIKRVVRCFLILGIGIVQTLRVLHPEPQASTLRWSSRLQGRPPGQDVQLSLSPVFPAHHRSSQGSFRDHE